MKLVYYKGNVPNFGDELNWHIFEALFDNIDFRERYEKHYFMGIGSILHEVYFDLMEPDSTSILFGSGVRGTNYPAGNLKIEAHFVRGPISASIFDCKYITDAAYIFYFMREYMSLCNSEKKVGTVIVPYYTHINQVDWSQVTKDTGARIVMPYWAPHRVLSAMASAKKVIAGAMHGCILADCLRIPWQRLRLPVHELNNDVQDLKWDDWLRSIEHKKCKNQLLVKTNNEDPSLKEKLTEEISRLIEKAESGDVDLSNDTRFDEIINQLHSEILSFSKRYGIGLNSSRSIF